MTTAHTEPDQLDADEYDDEDQDASKVAPFAMVPTAVFTLGLSAQAIAVYGAIRVNVNYKTLRSWVGRETIAKRVGMSKANSVDRYIQELVDGGVITAQNRWHAPGNHKDWGLEKTKRHTVRATTLYTFLPVEEVAVSPGDNEEPQVKRPPLQNETVPPCRGYERDPLNETLSKTSKTKRPRTATPPTKPEPVDKWMRKWQDGEETPDARPLHPEWSPNNANRSEAAKAGLDLDAMAEDFRTGATASGKNSTCWGKAFTGYLRDFAANRAHVTYSDVTTDEVPAAMFEAGIENAKRLLGNKTPPAQAVTDTPEDPAPRPTASGYTRKLEKDLSWIEGLVGGPQLTGPERVLAADLLTAGELRQVVAGEIEAHRERAGVAA